MESKTESQESTIPDTIKPHINNYALVTLSNASDVAALYQNDYEILNDDMYALSGAHIKQISDSIRSVEESRLLITNPIGKSIKAIKAHFDGFKNILTQKKTIISGARLKYETIVEAERKVAEEAANKAAEEERRRLEAERKATVEEQERLEVAAAEAAAKGDSEAAENKLNQAIQLEQETKELSEVIDQEPVFITPTARMTKTAGVSTRKTWQVEVTSKMELIRAVAEGNVPPNALEINEKYLRQRAVSDGETYNIPGTRSFQKKSVAA